MKIIECVPNFSEGLNKKIIQSIADEIRAVPNVQLLNIDPGIDANRTVMTFAGEPDAVVKAAFQAIVKAVELVDMRTHKGVHARLGAVDVCPIIPISNVTMQECIELSRQLGKRVADQVGVPVYLYEESATTPTRVKLENIRRGEYEGLAEKLRDPDWAPDFGKAKFNAKSGATVIGARNFLIAYNINLNSSDRLLAGEIAAAIRESGRIQRDEKGKEIMNPDGTPKRIPGRLKFVKAIGWYIEEYDQAQVSMNLVNFHQTPIHVVYAAVQEEAEKLGLTVTGSELIGLVPLEALLDAGKFFAADKAVRATEQELLQSAISGLGLDDLFPFDPCKKILDYLLQEKL